ncbi:MAG TPA: MFS transporter [Dongiaceae bacterium]|nr:MFS transporter [Dongiaceae bacterium]
MKDQSTSSAATPPEGARWADPFKHGLALYTVMLNVGIGLHALDVFIISTVMPRVVHELGGAEYYTWATMLYMVASIIGTAAGNPVRQMLGSRIGYAVAALVFASGSIGCALSPSMFVLLVARVVQGLGGGTMIALSMSLVSELFPPYLRKRVLALVSAAWGVASLLGPAIGGTFAYAGWWRGAFWINVPIVLLFVLACTRLPKKKAGTAAIRFPYLQLATMTVAVAAVATASQVSQLAGQIALLALAAGAVALAIRFDHTSENRMFPSHPLSLARPIGTANWVMALSSVTHTVIGAYLPLSMQVLHHVSDRAAGYAMATLAFSWTVASMTTSHIHGPAAMRSIIIGQGLCLIGLSGMALAITDLPFAVVVALNAVVGFGLGSSTLHVVEASMRHAPAGEQTTTAGAIPTIRSLGIAFGSAGAGVIANNAGLTDALAYQDVARATQWVLSVGALAPLLAMLCALRFVRMINALPKAVAAD